MRCSPDCAYLIESQITRILTTNRPILSKAILSIPKTFNQWKCFVLTVFNFRMVFNDDEQQQTTLEWENEFKSYSIHVWDSLLRCFWLQKHWNHSSEFTARNEKRSRNGKKGHFHSSTNKLKVKSCLRGKCNFATFNVKETTTACDKLANCV